MLLYNRGLPYNRDTLYRAFYIALAKQHGGSFTIAQCIAARPMLLAMRDQYGIAANCLKPHDAAMLANYGIAYTTL